MQEERDLIEKEKGDETESKSQHESPENAEHPVPGIKHEHEPDAENIMPAVDRPGTF
ncbi:MAG: hypothetical protein M3209_08110 [Acidobacteriota bacterium]|nr:hypothetical protein [Acidobacteriota bacterium]